MVPWILFAAAGFWWIAFLRNGHEMWTLVPAVMFTITWVLYILREIGRRRDSR